MDVRTQSKLSQWRGWIGVLAAAVAAVGLQAADQPGSAPAAQVTGTAAAVEAPTTAAAPATVTAPAAAVAAPTAPAEPAVEAVSTSAAPAAAGAPAAPEPETVPVAGLTPPAEVQERISIALDDVPLQDVVRMFTRISGANIIATATNLGGKVTVNLQDVEWKPALSSILDIYNLQVSEKIPGSGIYSILPRMPGSEDPPIASTIFLNYASVSNVAALVAPLVGKGGSVASFPNCNALVVRATALNVNEIRKVVSEIDLPRKQVYIEAKFLELNDEAIKDLGVNWQVLEGYGVGVGSLQWSVQENRNKVQSNNKAATRQDSRTKTDTLNERYDANGLPYTESSTVVEEQPPGSGNFLSRTVTTPTRAVNDVINQSVAYQQDQKNNYEKTLADVRTAVLSADDFKLILSALKQQSGVSVVSNPKIIVANEQTATIHIGENEPNIKGTVTAGQQGQANTTTYTLDDKKPYFEFGIKLDVTPVINNASNITVSINPTLSRFVRNKVAPDNNSYPVEATKTITTTFSLESGKTAAIGGLTETNDRKEEVKVPLLGDIPLIGKYLFTHTHTARSQQETIIFVTVGIADPRSIGREEGLPEDAELVKQHMGKKRHGETPATTNAAPAATNVAPAAAAPVSKKAPAAVPPKSVAASKRALR